jgi:hypothetical protein
MLMVPIVVANGSAGCAGVYGMPHSLGALGKMFYHLICHETIQDFALVEAGRAGARFAP